MESRIGFIGAGQMAQCLIQGLLQNGMAAECIWVSNRNPEKSQALQLKHGVNIAKDNLDLVNQVDTIVLCVKPHQMKLVCSEIGQGLVPERQVVISIAAGIAMATLEKAMGKNISLIRAMPNTPALVRSGVTLLVANRYSDTARCDIAESIFRAVGSVKWLEDEASMDTATVLSGSGPAYFYVMMDALVQGAVREGLDPAMATELAIGTALGAARMALESDSDFKTLTAQVTSPGGVTHAALTVLESAHFSELISRMMTAAKARAIELRDEAN